MNVFLNKNVFFNVKIIYFIVFLVSFCESLFLLSFVLPTSIIAFFFSFLVGSKIINLYYIYIISYLGCIIGDILSYYIGKCFSVKYLYTIKNWLLKYSPSSKKVFFLFKRYIFLTILFGRFISPIRPFILFIAGLLNIPFKKIIFPCVISVMLWLSIYFFLSIFAKVILNITNNLLFNIYLIFLISLIIIYIFLLYNWLININFFFKGVNNLKFKRNIYIYMLSFLFFMILYITFIIINCPLFYKILLLFLQFLR